MELEHIRHMKNHSCRRSHHMKMHNRRMKNHSCHRSRHMKKHRFQLLALPSDPDPDKQCVSSELEQCGIQFVCQCAAQCEEP